jgi:peroxiredoxin
MRQSSGRWMRVVLWIAAAYNLLWGGWVILFPESAFRWAAMPAPNYPELWQGIGMIVGVYGVSYALAARNPLVHWPVVAAGLLGKILGPIGFLYGVHTGRFPWIAGVTILTNDVIWWAPFALILHRAYREHIGAGRLASPQVQRMAMRAKTNLGPSILELSQLSPILLVFLRHTGCTFCREALADLAEQRRRIEASGTRLVLVHMSPEERAREFFRRYGLEDAPRVSDPGRALYRAFGLGRGGALRLLGPKVWLRGFQAGILNRHGIGRVAGDVFQMPGVFLVYHGAVLRSYRHHTAADRPDYLALAAAPVLPGALQG